MAFDVLDSVFSIWRSLCTHVKGHPQLIAGTFLGDGPVIFGALLYKIARPRSQLLSFWRITSHLDIFAGILHFLRKESSGLLSSWTRGRHSCWLPASWEQQAGWDPTPPAHGHSSLHWPWLLLGTVQHGSASSLSDEVSAFRLHLPVGGPSLLSASFLFLLPRTCWNHSLFDVSTSFCPFLFLRAFGWKGLSKMALNWLDYF